MNSPELNTDFKYYNIGDIVELTDKIEPSIKTIGTVKLIEQDDEIEQLQWLYLVANDENLNIYSEPHVGIYWELARNNDPQLKKISDAIM